MSPREQRLAEMIRARAQLDRRIRQLSVGCDPAVIQRVRRNVGRHVDPEDLRAYYAHLNGDTEEVTERRRDELAEASRLRTRAAA